MIVSPEFAVVGLLVSGDTKWFWDLLLSVLIVLMVLPILMSLVLGLVVSDGQRVFE